MRVISRVKVKGGSDKILKKLRDSLDENIKILVGIPKDAGSYEEGPTVAQVGATNEFGSEEGNIPERSFMRSSMEENQPKYIKMAQRGVKKVVDGKLSLEQVAGLIGTEAEGDIKQKITDLKEPPNSPFTIEKKGSDNPLIDTGRMRQSIRYEIRKGK